MRLSPFSYLPTSTYFVVRCPFRSFAHGLTRLFTFLPWRLMRHCCFGHLPYIDRCFANIFFYVFILVSLCITNCYHLSPSTSKHMLNMLASGEGSQEGKRKAFFKLWNYYTCFSPDFPARDGVSSRKG